MELNKDKSSGLGEIPYRW